MLFPNCYNFFPSIENSFNELIKYVFKANNFKIVFISFLAIFLYHNALVFFTYFDGKLQLLL